MHVKPIVVFAESAVVSAIVRIDGEESAMFGILTGGLKLQCIAIATFSSFCSVSFCSFIFSF